MQRKSSQSLITDCFKENNNGGKIRTNPPAPKKPACVKRPRPTEATPSLHKYKFLNPDKRSKIDLTMVERKARATVSTIGITYRQDGEGAGAIFDHQTLQLSTDNPTAMINTDEYSRDFDKAIRGFPNFLKYGIKVDKTEFTFPRIANINDPDLGLLVIPGVSAKSFTSNEYKIRHASETAIIKQALMRGQPILGICGGSWTLYQQYGGTLKSVEGHSYRGGMPRLGKNDGLPSHNKQMHRIRLCEESTLLQAGLHLKAGRGENITVNSVHSYAPDDRNIPAELVVSATAIADATLAPSNCKPTEISIEAFESKNGTPVLGIQWHPEAYANTSAHAQLLRYMTQAGHRYKTNRLVQKELRDNFKDIRSGLKKQNKLAYNYTAVRKATDKKVIFTLFNLKHTHDVRHLDEAKIEGRSKENYLLDPAYKVIGKK